MRQGFLFHQITKDFKILKTDSHDNKIEEMAILWFQKAYEPLPDFAHSKVGASS
jgi:hypothetical protein